MTTIVNIREALIGEINQIHGSEVAIEKTFYVTNS